MSPVTWSADGNSESAITDGCCDSLMAGDGRWLLILADGCCCCCVEWAARSFIFVLRFRYIRMAHTTPPQHHTTTTPHHHNTTPPQHHTTMAPHHQSTTTPPQSWVGELLHARFFLQIWKCPAEHVTYYTTLHQATPLTTPHCMHMHMHSRMEQMLC